MLDPRGLDPDGLCTQSCLAKSETVEFRNQLQPEAMVILVLNKYPSTESVYRVEY